MITYGKFSSLKKITKYFHLAKELKKLRDDLAEGFETDLLVLRKFYEYLTSSGEIDFIKDIENILSESDDRKKFERIHFLFHSIKEHFGYPEPENRFVMTTQDKEEGCFARSELILILENLRSAFNVGSIIRSCECFGVKKVYLSGITPDVENQKVIKTAKDAEKYVDIEYCPDIAGTISLLKKQNYVVTGAETGTGTIDLRDYIMPSRTVLIFGNEEIGITSDTLTLCDYIVSISMSGKKNSMNVAGAASVFMYEYSKNHRLSEPGSS